MKNSIQTKDGIVITNIPQELMTDPEKKALRQFVAEVRQTMQASGETPPPEGIPYPRGMIDKVGDALNTGMDVGIDIAGNAATLPVSGIAGIGAGINTLIGSGQEGDAARAVEAVQAKGRELFDVKTPQGQRTMGSIAEATAPVVQPAVEGFERLSQASGDLAYGEAVEADTLPPKGQSAVGAAGYTLPTAILELATLGLFGRMQRGAKLIDERGRATPEFEKELANYNLDFETLDPVVKDSIPAVVTDELFEFGRAVGDTAEGIAKDEMRRGSNKRGLASFNVEADRVVKDPIGQRAVDQGFDSGYVAATKNMNASTKKEAARMAKMQKALMEDRTKAVDMRPTDIVGDAVIKDINYLDDLVSKNGRELDKYTKSDAFKNAEVSMAPIATELKKVLDDRGVTYDPSDLRGSLDFEGSDIQFDKSAQGAIDDVLAGLDAKSLTPQRMHQLKRTFDTLINYKSKTMREMSPDSQKIIKSIRRALNTELRKTSPTYAKLNTDLSEALDATSDFDQAMKSVSIDGDMAAGGIGQQLRVILGKRQSRAEIVKALRKLRNTSKALGGKNDIDPAALTLFSDMLDSRFGDIASRGFAQESAKGVEQALKSSGVADMISKRGMMDKGMDMVTGSTVEARRAAAKEKGDNEAFKALRDLLEQGNR